MTTISAKVIADSISPEGIRLTSMQLKYPRSIHAELMTHRVFSRNASSSRAVPVPRMIQEIRDDPVIPLWWGTNQPGMQAFQENTVSPFADMNLDGHMELFYGPEDLWLTAMEHAIAAAEGFYKPSYEGEKQGYHKQVINRLLEPFSHISVIVTATEWNNFFNLRLDSGAEPHMRALSYKTYEARSESRPNCLKPGDWHLPYFNPITDCKRLCDHFKTKTYDPVYERRISTARCARVSYLNHEGKDPSLEEDFTLYDRLMEQRPVHASPPEHQATPDTKGWFGRWKNPKLHGNLNGWIQFRKTLPYENATNPVPPGLLVPDKMLSTVLGRLKNAA